eukprot:Platyproteum_vivax@DN7658_c0_g1_i2.p1
MTNVYVARNWNVSLLGVAVGKDVFLPDAKECMEAMLTIMHSGEVKDDDPLQEYLPDSIQRICRVLQEDFACTFRKTKLCRLLFQQKLLVVEQDDWEGHQRVHPNKVQ